ncbi:SUMO-interacting motif-containing protein 1, partial [Pseudolycoriella hygida]
PSSRAKTSLVNATVTRQRNGDSSQRNGDSSQRNGDSSQRNGDSSQRNGDSSQRNGDSSQRNGDSSPRNGDSSQRNGDSSQRNGDSSQRNGDSSQRNGDSSQRNGDSSQRNGDSSTQRQNPWCESDKKVPFATTFEDNFTSESAEKLPDSKEYIERLEKKLNNLKVNSSITKQLAERREECMEKLLIGAIELSSDSEDSDLKPASKLIRRIVPEQPRMNTFRETFVFLAKLAWNSRVTLPIIITGAFMVMDIRMQVEINIHTERMVREENNAINQIAVEIMNDSDSWETIDSDASEDETGNEDSDYGDYDSDNNFIDDYDTDSNDTYDNGTDNTD